jgi:hypothetical protein
MAQTAAERAAREQALEYVRLMQIQQARSGVGVPLGHSSTALAGICRASSVQTITPELDFALDDPVATTLLKAALANGANRDCIAAWASSCPPDSGGTGQFIGPMPPKAPSPAPVVIDDPFWDATFGLGNISANLFGVYQGIDHSIARTVLDIRTQRATALIVSGAQQSAKINAHVTIYDANAPRRAKALKAGQPIPADSAAPRIRAKLTNLPTTVVDPAARAALKSAVVGAARGGTNFGTAAQAKINNALISADWEKRSKFFGTKAGAGVLAFGPTLVIDLAATTTRLKSGALQVDHQELAARSAGSQASNLVGVLAGVAVVVFLPITATAATVVIVGLGAGIIAQGVFGLFGADKAISNVVRDAQGRPRQ